MTSTIPTVPECVRKRIGLEYGKLTIIGYSHSVGHKHYIIVQCICSNYPKKKPVVMSRITSGEIISCGCERGRKILLDPVSKIPLVVHNRLGMVFGKLTICEYAGSKRAKDGWTRHFVRAICACGNPEFMHPIDIQNILDGNTSSCGCLVFENPGRERIYTEYELNAMAAFRGSITARKQGNLTFEQFIILSKLPCVYCGAPPSNRCAYGVAKYRRDSLAEDQIFIYSGMDRLNNSLPHDYDNCVPCCAKCNAAKSDNLFSDFIEHARKIVEYQNNKPISHSINEIEKII